MKSNIELDRRTVLGAVGSLAVAGSGLAVLSDGASATAGSDINDVALSSDDGTIEYIQTDTSGQLDWDGFDREVHQLRIRVAVIIGDPNDPNWQGVIHDTGRFDLADVSDEGGSDGWGGDDEYTSGPGTHGYFHSGAVWDVIQADSYESDYSLPSDPAPAQPLYATRDGNTKETTVTLKSTYLMYASDGTELTGTSEYPERPVAESTFTVSVTNQESSTGFSDGDGSASGGVADDRK